jgi:hypothetical protein
MLLCAVAEPAAKTNASAAALTTMKERVLRIENYLLVLAALCPANVLFRGTFSR